MPADELRHEPGPEDLWSESWYFDFATTDAGLGGWVRIGLHPARGTVWYHTYLAGPDRQLLAVVETDVPLPRRGLEIRHDGLWASHICETPFEHWTIGLEAFALGVDDPDELYGRGLGDRVALGFDLEWETVGDVYPYPAPATRYEVSCTVHGEVLVGDDVIDVDAVGQRHHAWGSGEWWSFPAGPFRVDDLDVDIEPVAVTPVLLAAPDGRTSRCPRALCRFSAADGRVGVGWTEWNPSERDGTPGNR